MVDKDIKVLVVDDTVTDRQLLSKIVSGFDMVEVIGTAPNGKIALSKIRILQPDLVLLDVYMPEMDGIQTLEHIKKEFPHIDVIILSALDHENAQLTMAALSAGALDFITKPKGPSYEANLSELTLSLSRLVSIARTRKYSRQVRGISDNKPISKKNLIPDLKANLIRHPAVQHVIPKPEPPIHLSKEKIRKSGKIDVVAIGVSTGGPNALQEIIPKLDADIPVPILTVQHMPPMFTASLAVRLNSLSQIRVLEGQEGMLIEKGVMFIAPGGRHMVVRKDELNRKTIGLIDSPPVNSCRPSVDVLFRSIAMVYGGNVLSVILTGMGNDGVSGVLAILRKGGYSIVQDEKSSIIWGMPGAVVAANAADEIVPLDRMAYRISEIVKEGHL